MLFRSSRTKALIRTVAIAVLWLTIAGTGLAAAFFISYL